MTPVERYVQASLELEAARAALADAARWMRDFAHNLETRRGRMAFVNLPGSTFLDRLREDVWRWDAATAPDPARLQAMLEAHFEALAAARSAWEAIPPEQRAVLTEPKP